jgi:hypothetical protein
LGSPIQSKAAFNNFPYQYGVVERTYSEHKSGLLANTPVSGYLSLPAELRAGAIKAAYESSIIAGTGGNYEDGSTRYFNCQTCHLRAVTGSGCNKMGAPLRKDLPLHDMTGGNYWAPDAIKYLDSQGKLRLGGGLTGVQLAAIDAGKTRALKQLSEAVSLSVVGNTLRVVNLTGHKVITGYPEGRRMWLNIKWYDGVGNVLREDGRYGPLSVTIDGAPRSVNTILDLNDPNTRIYEAHYGVTQEWAGQLLALGYPADLPLGYDRATGSVSYTLGELSAQAPGTAHESFHFVLNNTVVKDNRIPPYGMSYDEGKKRNILPVPSSQYGNPGPGGTYNCFDQVALNPPAGAVYATVDLLYQPTSWEYIQFLYLANTRQNAFLAEEGAYLLEAWLNTGMAAPYKMASALWGTPPEQQTPDLVVDSLATWSVSKNGTFVSPADLFSPGSSVGIKARTADSNSQPLSGAQLYVEVRNAKGALVTTLQGFSGTDGYGNLAWKTSRNQPSGIYSANITVVIKSGYTFNPQASVTSVTFALR